MAHSPRITLYVIFTCMLAGAGGLVYGYDLVAAGGISAMDDFLVKFFPNVYKSRNAFHQGNYCRYDNQVFQLFSSSLYIAALLTSFVAGSLTRKLGHRSSMRTAGALFIAGTILGTFAHNLPILIIGRLLLGCGLGFSNQAIPLYISEIAPARYRGTLNMFFGISIGLGIFAGNLVSYLASSVRPSGWRITQAMTSFPAFTITLAGFALADTPTFLIRTNKHEQALQVLRKLRGHNDVMAEFEDLLKATQIAEQFSGNDAIVFYGPFLFRAAGLGERASLFSTLFTGISVLAGSVISIFSIDKAGRKTLLLLSTLIMLFCMVAAGTIFAVGIKGAVTRLSGAASGFELATVCLYLASFSASWGPLAWIIPSEILSQNIRSAGQSVTVFTNMLFKFVIAQTFLSMLCSFKFATFFFFAGWLFLMAIFALLFVPETKAIPIDEMVDRVWGTHWFWRYFVTAPQKAGGPRLASVEMKPSFEPPIAAPITVHPGDL
ncbi:hypothetical protein KP509_01G020100 [Ceratopteris richardii]|uniref:Major facilitator superfamily (MFS) profile domain-containing protein n=1 Tax=Ceratopteris richardii TaxID=49495 RepID=A0A8T2VEP2_CERRI|nr:hypothetical protein KP509_01G020100 [Ceratopteris richardii]